MRHLHARAGRSSLFREALRALGLDVTFPGTTVSPGAASFASCLRLVAGLQACRLGEVSRAVTGAFWNSGSMVVAGGRRWAPTRRRTGCRRVVRRMPTSCWSVRTGCSSGREAGELSHAVDVVSSWGGSSGGSAAGQSAWLGCGRHA